MCINKPSLLEMEALVRKRLQFTENKILMKFLLKIADEM